MKTPTKKTQQHNKANKHKLKFKEPKKQTNKTQKLKRTDKTKRIYTKHK